MFKSYLFEKNICYINVDWRLIIKQFELNEARQRWRQFLFLVSSKLIVISIPFKICWNSCCYEYIEELCESYELHDFDYNEIFKT